MAAVYKKALAAESGEPLPVTADLGAGASSHPSLRQGNVITKISILMPVYNEERYIAEAIESVLAQTHRNFELIILNDGSKDHTLEIAQSYARRDSRVHVESHENIGIGPTLNKGFALAANEWVALMHGDDVLMPNRLERNLVFLDEHPELAVAAGWYKNIDGEGRIVAKGELPLTTHEAVRKLYEANELISFMGCTALVRKSAVQAVGGYRPQFRVNEDADLWNRLLENGYKILLQPEYLAKYRIHAGSVSVSQARTIYEQARWVKDCMVRRRSGQTERSWEEFLSFRRTLPWYVRANAKRKDTSKVLYKAAVFQFARRKYFLLVPTVLAAMILQPTYAIPQITSKFLPRRS
jgi:glycosyltransferase involved in cell wall biosynthesis